MVGFEIFRDAFDRFAALVEECDAHEWRGEGGREPDPGEEEGYVEECRFGLGEGEPLLAASVWINLLSLSVSA